MCYTAPTSRHGFSDTEHAAYLAGHSAGWDHANYVAAYGPNADTAAPIGLSDRELMYWRDGYSDGVEAFDQPCADCNESED